MVPETKVTEKLNSYELVVIIRPDLEEEAQETIANSVKEFVEGRGGEVEETKVWGKRRLAYPIDRHAEGYYVLYHFKGKASDNRDLEAMMRISENFLRHLLIKIN